MPTKNDDPDEIEIDDLSLLRMPLARVTTELETLRARVAELEKELADARANVLVALATAETVDKSRAEAAEAEVERLYKLGSEESSARRKAEAERDALKTFAEFVEGRHPSCECYEKTAFGHEQKWIGCQTHRDYLERGDVWCFRCMAHVALNPVGREKGGDK